ncbi:MAG: histidinol-phosphatase [Alistipes sp.]|nr:histidinol-phosphatase [Alistipes sp.]
MRKISLMLVAMLTAASVSAQYYEDAVNKEMLHIRQPRTVQRTEFIIPSIDGYTAYKADLHTHTIFSDGHLSMESRVREAWKDGIDVMAVTEHLEHRPHEKDLVKYMEGGYIAKGTKAQANTFVSRNFPEKGAIKVNLNFPVELATKIAKDYDLTIIPGIEITRKPDGVYTHLNALFTKDNNAIYDPDPMQSTRNAKAQGALIMHNHPGWLRTDMKPSKFDKAIYKEGLVDGIEVMNGVEFYPKAITRAKDMNFFVSANTDAHHPTAERYAEYGEHRNMTIIFAKDKSLESLREALEARRTLACSFGVLAGDEALLRKVAEASLTVRRMSDDAKGRKRIIVTNNSSIRWIIARAGQRTEELRPHSSQIFTAKTKENTATLLNTWSGEESHIVINLFDLAK